MGASKYTNKLTKEHRSLCCFYGFRFTLEETAEDCFLVSYALQKESMHEKTLNLCPLYPSQLLLCGLHGALTLCLSNDVFHVKLFFICRNSMMLTQTFLFGCSLI